MVAIMAIGANLPDSVTVALDKRYLLAGLYGIVAVSLIKYLKFTLILVVVILAVGANLPEEMSEDLGVDRSIMLFALVAMITISLTNHIFKLPTGLETDRKGSTTIHGVTALYSAITKGRLSTVRALLDQGVNVNVKIANGQTPLMYACSKGYGDVVQLLLERGANPNITDNAGKTALQIAREKGYTRVASLLENTGRKSTARPAQTAPATRRAAPRPVVH